MRLSPILTRFSSCQKDFLSSWSPQMIILSKQQTSSQIQLSKYVFDNVITSIGASILSSAPLSASGLIFIVYIICIFYYLFCCLTNFLFHLHLLVLKCSYSHPGTNLKKQFLAVQASIPLSFDLCDFLNTEYYLLAHNIK